MKFFIAAIAMTIAIPAAAQTAQTADPHAGHQMPADHGKHDGKAGHEGKDCCDHKTADGKMMDCCEKAKAAGGKMECCEKHAKAADAHAGHDMSKR